MSGAEMRYEELFARASRATSDDDCERCLAEIELALDQAVEPVDRGRLLMCQARVRSNQWRTADVCADARAAMDQFELAGDWELAADAASWAAGHASRLGELSLASELAARSLLALDSVTQDRLRVEIFNRLGIFCYSFLDYDRAIEQFENSLAAAERAGASEKIYRQLHNIADALLLAARQRQLAGVQRRGDGLQRAEGIARWLLEHASDEFNQRAASHRLLAEALCELGRVEEAAEVLGRFRYRSDALAPAAQRAALAWIEARCARSTGEPDKAVTDAVQAVEIARDSEDDHELMLALEELAACQEAAGDLEAALTTTREVKARMWTIHQRQTGQLVSEVWARADLVRDQLNLRTAAAEASRWAEEDALTGLGNRRRLERFLRDEARDRGLLTFILVDLDLFKQINDSFGHDIGDAVLRKVGALLNEQTRASQVAVRYGGDEFVLGLAGVQIHVATEIASRIRHTIERYEWDGLAPGLRVTASHGVASGAASGWELVLADADTALYAAKQAGRNAVATAPAAERRWV